MKKLAFVAVFVIGASVHAEEQRAWPRCEAVQDTYDIGTEKIYTVFCKDDENSREYIASERGVTMDEAQAIIGRIERY